MSSMKFFEKYSTMRQVSRRTRKPLMSKPSQQQLLALVRAALICVTAFGLRLSADQVAAVQLVAEAALQAFYRV
jgi:hypothetical protein